MRGEKVDELAAADMWIGTVPGQEQMTLSSRTSNINATPPNLYTIWRAKRRPLTQREMMMSGALLSDGTQIIEVWQEALTNAVPIAPATLPCPLPKVGDAWTDASGTNWVIVPSGADIGLFDKRINTHVQKQIAGN